MSASWGSIARLAAALALAAASLILAGGCGDEDDAEPEAETITVAPQAALISALIDNQARALARLEAIGEASDEETRAEIADALGELSRTAKQLGDAEAATSNPDVADAAGCFAAALSKLSAAMEAEPGTDAEDAITGRSGDLNGCLDTLAEAARDLEDASDSDVDALLARIDGVRLKEPLVTALSDALAAPAEVVSEPGPEPTDPVEPVEDPPPETGLPPASELSFCSGTNPPPCINPETGEPIYTFGE